MAYLYRVVVALLLLVCGGAQATITPVTVYAVSSSRAYSAAAACQEWIATLGSSYSYVSNTNNSCVYLLSGSQYGTSISIGSGAPANATCNGSVCACNTNYSDNGSNQCVSNALSPSTSQAAADSLNSSGDQFCTTQHQVTGLSVCDNGVAFRGGVIVTGTSTNTDGSLQQCIQGPFTATGYNCSGVDTSVSDNGTCKGGKVPGTVNGVTVCVSPGSATAAGPSSTASSPSGSASNPTSGLGNSAPPTATGSTQSTTCTTGTCTTTTTYTNAAGTTVGTTSTQQPQQSFCSQNAGSPLCLNSEFSQSDCTTAPVCSGDAIQCGIANIEWKSYCAGQTNAATTAQEISFNNALSVTGDQTQGSSIASTVNISPASFSTADLTGGGSGLSSLTVTVAGNPVTFDFSVINYWAGVLGNVLLAVTGLLCFSILAKKTS